MFAISERARQVFNLWSDGESSQHNRLMGTVSRSLVLRELLGEVV
jgi:hypothetical protein